MTDSAEGAPPVECFELAPGVDVPRIIVGCWQLASDHGGAFDREDILERLLLLAEAGFDTFDGADIYTGVEELLGEVRRRAATRSTRPRVRIHTKVVPDLGTLPSLGRADVESLIDRSLRRLGADRLDLVQFHWWDFRIPGWLQAAAWLDELRRRGKIRHLGVTNFDAARLRSLLDAGIPVVSNQVQYSVLDRRPEGELAELARERGVRLLAYGSLAGGLLTDRWRGRGDPGTNVENRSLVKYRLIVEEAGGWPSLQRVLEALHAVGKRHGRGVAEVACRWTLDQPGVAACVTGLSRRPRIDQYRSVLALRLSEEDRSAVDVAIRSLRPVPGKVYALEREPGGRHATIMKTDLNRGA